MTQADPTSSSEDGSSRWHGRSNGGPADGPLCGGGVKALGTDRPQGAGGGPPPGGQGELPVVREPLSFWTVPSSRVKHLRRVASALEFPRRVARDPERRGPEKSPCTARVVSARIWISAWTRYGGPNEVRALRAQLKRDLKAGRLSIGPLLLDPPPFLETAKVFDVLLALPRHGRVKAIKILHSCRVSLSATFGGLSERQRTELAGHVDR
jgi:hypothetical protein